MYYEINVSFNGNHYFATAKRSLTDSTKAGLAYDDFTKRFPLSEGFQISMTLHTESGQTIRQNFSNKDINQ